MTLMVNRTHSQIQQACDWLSGVVPSLLNFSSVQLASVL
uniref:Uncharacterized protein n=1 Tax=Anguilla anguilla TaxID=7936 RepID=A0A0E9VZK7_ANGAN